MQSQKIKKASFVHYFLFIGCCLLLFNVSVYAYRVGEKEKHAKENIGSIIGVVLDLENRTPVSDATVYVERNGEFITKKNFCGKTTSDGTFKLSTELGISSSELDVGSLLLVSPLSFMLNPKSITKETRTIDISYVNLKIEKDGYETFIGSVPIFQTSSKENLVNVYPVLLAKSNSGFSSFADTKFLSGKTIIVKVTPSVIVGKEDIIITAKIPDISFPVDKKDKVKINIRNEDWSYDKNFTLKDDGKSPDEVAGDRIYTVKIKSDKKFLKDDIFSISARYLKEETTFLRGEGSFWTLYKDESQIDAVIYYKEKLASGKDKILVEKEMINSFPSYLPPYKSLIEYYLEENKEISPEEKENKLNEGLELSKKAVEKFPDIPIFKIYLGEFLYKQKNYSEALSTLEKVEEKELSKLEKTEKIKYYFILGEIKEAQGDLKSAIDYYDKVKKIDKYYPTPKEKLLALEKVKNNPQDAKLWYEYSGYLSKKEKEEVLRKVIELDNNHQEAKIELARYLLDNQKYEEAIKYFKEVLDVNPKNEKARIGLGMSYFRQGKLENAKQELEKVLSDDLKDFYVYCTLGNIAYKQQDKDNVLKYWKKAIQYARAGAGGISFKTYGGPIPSVYGGGMAVFYARGKVKFYSGFKYEEADDIVNIIQGQEILTKFPDNFLAEYNIGSSLVNLELFDDGINVLKDVLNKKDNFVDAHFKLGEAYYKKGQDELAIQELNKTTTLNPYHPDAYLLLADIYKKQGKNNQARNTLEKYLKYYPEDKEVKKLYEEIPVEKLPTQEKKIEDKSSKIIKQIEDKSEKKEVVEPIKKKEDIKTKPKKEIKKK